MSKLNSRNALLLISGERDFEMPDPKRRIILFLLEYPVGTR